MPFIDMKTSKQQLLFSIDRNVYDIIRKKICHENKKSVIKFGHF